MFSGIVEEMAVAAALKRRSGGLCLAVESELDHSAAKIGDSIAIEGVCLTVRSIRGRRLEFDLSEETARRSTLALLRPGAPVNLERSIQLGARLHGHLVFGHIDATVALKERVPEGASWRYSFELPQELRSMAAPKGSLALNGVSLTVGEVGAGYFNVYVVPHTASITTLGRLAPGGRANLEIDILARYVRAHLTGLADVNDGRLLKLLAENGYIGGRMK